MKRRSAIKVLKRFEKNPIPKNTHVGTGSGRKETKRFMGSLGGALGLKAKYTKTGYSGKTLARAYGKLRNG